MSEGTAAPSRVVEAHLDHRPAPKGSYKGRARPDARGRYQNAAGQFTGSVVFTASSAALTSYRQALAWSVRAACGRRPALNEPVKVVIRWTLPAPKAPAAHSYDNQGRAWPATVRTGDTDKLQRAVFDALTEGGAIADDARIVGADVLAEYGEPASPTWQGSTFVQVMPVTERLAG